MMYLHPLTLTTILMRKSMLESQMQNLVRFLRTLLASVALDKTIKDRHQLAINLKMLKKKIRLLASTEDKKRT
jgi:hypothetical protein